MSLILIIGVIVIGVVLTVAGETQFDLTGFILVLSASVMSGLRWSLTQMLLQKDQLGMDNPVATLYYISPIMFMLMSILSLLIEDPFVQFESSEFFNDFNSGVMTLLMAGGGGFLAFAMTVAEFKLIKNTGTVTLSVAGISKEIVVISLSMMIFGDRLTFVNLLGYVSLTRSFTFTHALTCFAVRLDAMFRVACSLSNNNFVSTPPQTASVNWRNHRLCELHKTGAV